MVEITEKAKEKIQEALDKNTGKYLRIVVEGIGWGGPRLGLTLDEPEGNENPVQINGLDVLIADTVMPLADGVKVDYVKEFYGEGFVVTGPGGAC